MTLSQKSSSSNVDFTWKKTNFTLKVVKLKNLPKMADLFICNASLSDYSMDSDTIVCGADVDFGMLNDFACGSATKASPSHSSDSGCSDMDIRSVSSPVGVDLLEPGDDVVRLFDFDFNDKEVADIFDNETEVDIDVGVDIDLETPNGSRPNKDNSYRTKTCSPDVIVDVGDDEMNDPTYVPGKRIVQAKAIVPKVVSQVIPQANIIKAPPAQKRVLESNGNEYNGLMKLADKQRPAVKVVKVIKTASTSKQEIENELFEALDERNKKNACQAKINRERKKAYMKSLEDEVQKLKQENTRILADGEKERRENIALREEVEYLKNVLANQSMISGLLKNLGKVENVKLSSSFSRKRGADLDHDYSNADVKKARVSKSAGVCLHVENENVSIEFCAKCASMAKCDGSG